jgi:DNA-binding NarL/FixJ family response regulator
MMSRGYANKEIGAGLHLSEHTVKSHVKTIFRKLGAKTDRSRLQGVHGEADLPEARFVTRLHSFE